MDTTITLPVDFDLMSFEDVQSADVRIKAPDTGAPTPLVISLAGPEHPKRRKIQLDRQRRLRAAAAHRQSPARRPRRRRAGGGRAAGRLHPGVDRHGGQRQVVEFSRAKALEIYTDPRRQWLRAQVKTALDDREVLFGARGRLIEAAGVSSSSPARRQMGRPACAPAARLRQHRPGLTRCWSHCRRRSA